MDDYFDKINKSLKATFKIISMCHEMDKMNNDPITDEDTAFLTETLKSISSNPNPTSLDDDSINAIVELDEAGVLDALHKYAIDAVALKEVIRKWESTHHTIERFSVDKKIFDKLKKDEDENEDGL